MKFFKYKYILCLILVFFNCFAVENEEDVKSKLKLHFDVFLGYNNDSDFAKNSEYAILKQDNPFFGVSSKINYSNLKVFDVNYKDFRYGIISEIGVNSFDISNPIYLSEASFVISSETSGNRIFGLQKTATSKLKIDSTSFAGENEGINGAWQNLLKYPFLNTNSGPVGAFMTKTFMPVSSGITSAPFLNSVQNGYNVQPFENWGEGNIGISYISKRTKGLRFGVSYFADNKTNLLFEKKNLIDKRGFEFYNESSDYLRNIISTGANFYHQFESTFEVSLFLGYEYANFASKDYQRKDLNAVSGGFNFGYLGFTLGGSYTFLGESLRIKNIPVPGNNIYIANNSTLKTPRTDYNYDLGLGYSIDKYTINISYFESMYSQNLFRSGVFSFEVKLNENISNYFQLANYTFILPRQDILNLSDIVERGTIFLFGIKYKM